MWLKISLFSWIKIVFYSTMYSKIFVIVNFYFLNPEGSYCTVSRFQVFPLLAEVTELLGWSCRSK